MVATQIELIETGVHRRAAEELGARMRGRLIQRDQPDYEQARRVWNGLIDKRPELIARCTGTADVVEAVCVASAHGLELAVRGGGHNVSGSAVNEGGLVIDLSLMKGVTVDPERQTVRVQPGANWGDVDRETQVFGLATPGGQVSTTGVAGFTLAGGMGFLRRKWGLACDNLLSVEVVTADGRVITASAREHPNLFWSVRGGGGNFGIITSFEFQLYPVGPEIYIAAPIYPLHPIEQSREILRGWRDFIIAAPDDVTSDCLLWAMPSMPHLPVEMHGMPVLILPGVYAGSPEEGMRALQPLRELGPLAADLSHAAPYVAIQSDFDAFFPDGGLYYWKSLFVDVLPDDVVDMILAAAAARPSPQVLLALRALGGAMGRVPEDATAYGNRQALFNLSIDASWMDSADTQRHIDWTRQTWSDLRDLTGGGVYLNFAGLGEDGDMLVRAAYGANYDRLREIKRRYDPDNLFHGNVNIVP